MKRRKQSSGRRLFLRLLVPAVLIGLSACRPVNPFQPVDPLVIPPMVDSVVNAVIEIPAGTNTKIEYDKVSGKYLPDLEGGAVRKVRFLPYPGNYGFIPNTLVSAAEGGDGDPLDVLVLSESRPTGSLIRCIPIAALVMKDGGELDTKIIAVPADTADRLFDADNYLDFALEFEPAKRMIENWFVYYKGYNAVELVGWEDGEFAMNEIKKWQILKK